MMASLRMIPNSKILEFPFGRENVVVLGKLLVLQPGGNRAEERGIMHHHNKKP